MSDNNNTSKPSQNLLGGDLQTSKQTEVVNTAGKVGKSHHEYLKVMNAEKHVEAYRKITLEELAQHKTKDSAWLSLNGIVYDVTVYMNYHPGGTILLDGCGK